MDIRLARRAVQDFENLSPELKKRAKKQFRFLAGNLRYPSLNAKKYPEGGEGVWQARVDRSYRFYFLLEGNTYVILRITGHPK